MAGFSVGLISFLTRTSWCRSVPSASKKWTLPSSQAIMRVVPSGLKSAHDTASGNGSEVQTRRPDATSHSRAVLSRPPVASKAPSGWKRRALTPSVWPLRVRTACPSVESHSRTTLSIPAVASSRPSGLKQYPGSRPCERGSSRARGPRPRGGSTTRSSGGRPAALPGVGVGRPTARGPGRPAVVQLPAGQVHVGGVAAPVGRVALMRSSAREPGHRRRTGETTISTVATASGSARPPPRPT